MCSTRSPSPKAPATEAGGAALLLVGHGARGAAGAARCHAAALAGRGGFAETTAACLFGEPRLERVLAGLATPHVTLVPYLMAEGYTLRALARRLAAADGAGRVRCTPPLGAQPALARLIAAKAEAACREAGWRSHRTALLLVAHGTPRDPASGDTARRHAATIASEERFAEVAVAFLDEPPSVPEAAARTTAPALVAVGFFTDAGVHGEEDVPRLLREAGHPAAYTGPIGPAPEVAELILDQALSDRLAPAAE